MMMKKLPAGELTGSFKERLYQARRNKGWSQSELARQIWGTVEDSRGYVVAKNRDRVSSYERGKATPERENLEALAAALGLEVEELAPDLVAAREAASGGGVSGVHMTMLDGQPGMVRLQVDIVVPLDAATDTVRLLSKTTATK